MKYYEFKYSSKSSEIFEGFGYKLTNFIIPFVALIIINCIFRITSVAEQEWYSYFIKIAMAVALCVSVLLVIKFTNSPKGVFLYNDYIEIDRHSVSYWHLTKMNFTINISNISYCEIEKGDSSNHLDRYYHMMGGTGSPFVRIKTNDEKTYCFCIENQEDFLYRVNEKREALINKVNDFSES